MPDAKLTFVWLCVMVEIRLNLQLKSVFVEAESPGLCPRIQSGFESSRATARSPCDVKDRSSM